MDHIAIMNPEYDLLAMILAGKKTIESRWYKTRRTPWGKVAPGDRVFFKDAGKPVNAVATVARVEQFADLTLEKAREIVARYGDAICIQEKDVAMWAKGKRYCILVFLEHAQLVPPFRIRRDGFGTGAAWLTVPSVDAIAAS